jgi:hypothetical protein
MLQEFIVPTVCQLYADEDMVSTRPDTSLLHDVRAYLNNIFPDQWIGHRGCVEKPLIARLNPTWLFVVGLLEGYGVQQSQQHLKSSSKK